MWKIYLQPTNRKLFLFCLLLPSEVKLLLLKFFCAFIFSFAWPCFHAYLCTRSKYVVNIIERQYNLYEPAYVQLHTVYKKYENIGAGVKQVILKSLRNWMLHIIYSSQKYWNARPVHLFLLYTEVILVWDQKMNKINQNFSFYFLTVTSRLLNNLEHIFGSRPPHSR